ncbi:hypothetical protein BS78_K312900 [Paspalum vaginatum]|uniref:Jacalin-type lectin domain-containing protein n=1 Tax=Paspalum vaginatum TaxID=158149 RepID=A0A9W8CES6_9POAL|nr:hypothetical protein BS78_K312900 [Paspalum vaginatum]
MKVRHRNIIRLVGYCYEIRHKYVKVAGEYVFARMEERALCFEYLQPGGLDKHISDESCGFDWCTRYKIIKGICGGLNYLHNRLEEPIFHLDLKPANILLDKGMVPKIADFGLSRAIRGTHTTITEVCIGSEYYMPPEYMSKRQISNKNDIYSLGIIIIEIMTGPMGYTKYGETESPQEFMETVINNWRDRIGATSNYMEQECHQVKRCIEIAVSCINADRHRRPAISAIVRELKEIDTYTTESSSVDQDRVVKIGRWGGAGGSNQHPEIPPHRLESLIIFSGEVIYSLVFSYSDHNGLQYSAGPWGGWGPNRGSNRNEIQLGRSEYVREVSGTIGPFDRAPAGVITSLSLMTNVRTYGPFGNVKGTPFQIPVQSNGSIVGFFVRTGWYLDSVGVYVNPKLQDTVEDPEEKAPLPKIGPWGGNGGTPCDITVTPHRLESVTIHSDIVVNSIEFSYTDEYDYEEYTIGPWGNQSGSSCTIELGSSDFITALYGTIGPFTTNPPAASDDDDNDDDVVTSLTVITNAHVYGPFGQVRGMYFQMPMRGDGSIVGFFGRADSFLRAIGVYANPKHGELGRHAAVSNVGMSGPWGGCGGDAHYMDDEAAREAHRLVTVTIRSGLVVDSIEFTYIDRDGNEHTVGPWGGHGGRVSKIRLDPSESLRGISGSFGPFNAAWTDNVVVTSLILATNRGAYGPFGQGEGTLFTAPAESDGAGIVGFFARSGRFLNALGVYYTRAADSL